jgi:ABC-type dipeptide/oligopeptide/nickel transport system permease component
VTEPLHGLGYLGKRLVLAAMTFLGVTLLVFVLTVWMPGDSLDRELAARDADRTPDERSALIEQVERERGWDRPSVLRYANWLGDLLRLDLGRSEADGKLVSAKLLARIPYTLALNGAALLLIIGISVPLGTFLAFHRGGRLDRFAGFVLDLLYAAPYFWTAILLQYILAVRLGWLPYGAPSEFGLAGRGAIELWLDRAWHLVLPACLLAYGSLAYFVRFVRATVSDSLGQPFIVTARSLGLPNRVLVRKYVLRHAWIALIPLAGAFLGRLLAGSVLLESIFSWPGIGDLFAESVAARDYPVVQALASLSAGMVLAAGLLADLALVLADPRVSFGRVEP